MSVSMIRMSRPALCAAFLAVALAVPSPADAGRWGARQEFREGMREIARERREMRRDILNSGSRREARQAYREGMREIGRERREMRREVGRELRYGGWERDRVGGVVAGVVLGAVISAATRGVPPAAPAPGLCWYWSDPYQQNGYWTHCGAY
jgi:hypothetical protein